MSITDGGSTRHQPHPWGELVAHDRPETEVQWDSFLLSCKAKTFGHLADIAREHGQVHYLSDLYHDAINLDRLARGIWRANTIMFWWSVNTSGTCFYGLRSADDPWDPRIHRTHRYTGLLRFHANRHGDCTARLSIISGLWAPDAFILDHRPDPRLREDLVELSASLMEDVHTGELTHAEADAAWYAAQVCPRCARGERHTHGGDDTEEVQP